MDNLSMPEISSMVYIYMVGVFLLYMWLSDSGYLMPSIINEGLSLKCKID